MTPAIDYYVEQLNTNGIGPDVSFDTWRNCVEPIALQAAAEPGKWFKPEMLNYDKRVGYGRTMLYRDPNGKFVVVAFIWSEKKFLPPHDHAAFATVAPFKVDGAEGGEIYHPWTRDGEESTIIIPGDKCTVMPGGVYSLDREGIHCVYNEWDTLAGTFQVYSPDPDEQERVIYLKNEDLLVSHLFTPHPFDPALSAGAKYEDYHRAAA